MFGDFYFKDLMWLVDGGLSPLLRRSEYMTAYNIVKKEEKREERERESGGERETERGRICRNLSCKAECL